MDHDLDLRLSEQSLTALDLAVEPETKAVKRYVRTPEGARRFGVPIGTLITRDVVERAARIRKGEDPDLTPGTRPSTAGRTTPAKPRTAGDLSPAQGNAIARASMDRAAGRIDKRQYDKIVADVRAGKTPDAPSGGGGDRAVPRAPSKTTDVPDGDYLIERRAPSKVKPGDILDNPLTGTAHRVESIKRVKDGYDVEFTDGAAAHLGPDEPVQVSIPVEPDAPMGVATLDDDEVETEVNAAIVQFLEEGGDGRFPDADDVADMELSPEARTALEARVAERRASDLALAQWLAEGDTFLMPNADDVMNMDLEPEDREALLRTLGLGDPDAPMAAPNDVLERPTDGSLEEDRDWVASLVENADDVDEEEFLDAMDVGDKYPDDDALQDSLGELQAAVERDHPEWLADLDLPLGDQGGGGTPAESATERPEPTPEMEARGDGMTPLPPGKYEAGDPRNDPAYEAYIESVDKALGRALDQGLDTESMHSTVLPDGSRVWNRERQDVHYALLDQIMDEAEAGGVPKDGLAVMMGGLPGAGKSTFLRNHGDKLGLEIDERGEPTNAIVINPDNVKDLLMTGTYPDGRPLVETVPGLQRGEMAGLIHEESSVIAKMLAERVLAGNYNVVFDITLGDGDKARRKYLQKEDGTGAMDRGYTVRSAFIDGDLATSLHRAGVRHKQPEAGTGKRRMGGRYVPYSHIIREADAQGALDKDGNPAKSRNRVEYDKLLETGIFESAIRYDNATDEFHVDVSADDAGTGDEAAAETYVADQLNNEQYNLAQIVEFGARETGLPPERVSEIVTAQVQTRRAEITASMQADFGPDDRDTRRDALQDAEFFLLSYQPDDPTLSEVRNRQMAHRYMDQVDAGTVDEKWDEPTPEAQIEKLRAKRSYSADPFDRTAYPNRGAEAEADELEKLAGLGGGGGDAPSDRFKVGDVVTLASGNGSRRRVTAIDDERGTVVTLPVAGGGTPLPFRADDVRVAVRDGGDVADPDAPDGGVSGDLDGLLDDDRIDELAGYLEVRYDAEDDDDETDELISELVGALAASYGIDETEVRAEAAAIAGLEVDSDPANADPATDADDREATIAAAREDPDLEVTLASEDVDEESGAELSVIPGMSQLRQSLIDAYGEDESEWSQYGLGEILDDLDIVIDAEDGVALELLDERLMAAGLTNSDD